MAERRGFDVLVATDGSATARRAVRVAATFPWPPRARGHAVIARSGFLGAAQTEWPVPVWSALDESLDRLAAETRRLLAQRWPRGDVTVVDREPVEAILARSRALGTDVIVVGSRGHGLLRRLVLGSVSRGVVRRAACSVLVVKGRPRSLRRIVVGLDGSANARRAVRLLARLHPGARGHATVVAAQEPVRMPTLNLLPAGVRTAVRREAEAVAAEEHRRGRGEADTAATTLRAAGWRTDVVVTEGVPLDTLLRAVRRAGADVLVVGARGTGGVERLVLGSVADGALDRSPVSVLVAR